MEQLLLRYALFFRKASEMTTYEQSFCQSPFIMEICTKKILLGEYWPHW